MLRNYGPFILSVLLVVLVSWANVDYFGTSRTNVFSGNINQAVHLLAFLITAAIGYINWRKEEKWVGILWLTLYAFALISFLSSAAIFQFTGNIAIRRVGVGLRNRFTEPLPLLILFVILQAYKRLAATEKK